MPGQESFKTLDIEHYKEIAKDFLLKSSDQYFLKRKFGIGVDIDKNKLRHYQLISTVLESEETELIDWVIEKINGKLENKSYRIILDEHKEYILGGHPQIDSECVTDCCNWKELDW